MQPENEKSKKGKQERVEIRIKEKKRKNEKDRVVKATAALHFVAFKKGLDYCNKRRPTCSNHL